MKKKEKKSEIFTPEERTAYIDSLKYYRDLKNSLDTSFTEGEQIGLQKGITEGENKKAIKFAKKCLLKGMNIEETAEMTELSIEEVKKIADKL